MRRLGRMIATLIENESDYDAMVRVTEVYVEIINPAFQNVVRIYKYSLDGIKRADIVSIIKLSLKNLIDIEWVYGIEKISVNLNFIVHRWEERDENCYVIRNFEMWI